MSVEKVSLREFARRMGVSLAMIQKAIKSGRIETLPDGKISYKKQKANFENRKDISKQNVNEKTKESKASAFYDAKIKKEIYLAKLKELEYRREKRLLVDRAEVKNCFVKFCLAVKDSVMTLPERVTPEVVSLIVKELKKNGQTEMIKKLNVQEFERCIYKAWNKESRYVLENIERGPVV